MSMDFIDILTSCIGAGMVAGFVYVGRKLQVLDDLVEACDKMKANLKVVTDYLVTTHTDFSHAELTNYSPLQLTRDGEKLVQETGFKEIFRRHQADFFRCIESERPKLKYDVEAAAIKSISLLADRDYMEPVKVFLYNHPGRNLQNVAPTLGVYVRDGYLVQHPEITQ